jgi:hypothetical protein
LYFVQSNFEDLPGSAYRDKKVVSVLVTPLHKKS